MRLRVALLLVLSLGKVIAQDKTADIQIEGNLHKTLSLPQKNLTEKGRFLAEKPPLQAEKIELSLFKIKLSPQARAQLEKRQQKLAKPLQGALGSAAHPSKIQLGMNNVPVLNQGPYSTCVTFACTAALDATLNKGDYLSQICHLQLGNYLEKNAYGISGWNGAWSRTVLNQIETFGFINKEQQSKVGCGGLTEYPEEFHTPPESFFSPDEFHHLSEALPENLVWSPILDVYEALTEPVDTVKILEKVKSSLRAGDRLTFGVILFDFHLGFMGAVGTNKAPFDTWILTPELARDLYLSSELGGHAMVITGYDDKATVTDDQGRSYQGLLTLRNSWGALVGDKGEFYMTYDFFKLLVIEIQRIRTFKDSSAKDDKFSSKRASVV